MLQDWIYTTLVYAATLGVTYVIHSLWSDDPLTGSLIAYVALFLACLGLVRIDRLTTRLKNTWVKDTWRS